MLTEITDKGRNAATLSFVRNHPDKSMKNLLLFVLFLTAQVVLAQTPPVGVQLYSFRNQFAKDVPGTMAKVRDMGIKYVELAGTYGMPVPEFMKMLKDHGITAIGGSADFAKLDKDPMGVVNDNKPFGVQYVTCFWIPHNGNDFTIDDAKKAVEVFNRAGKLLADNGLKLTYHNHGYEFRPYENGTLFDYIAKNLDPRYCNFEMDVFWVKHPGQEPVALLKKYPNRFPLVHLKDRKPGTPGNQDGRADVETNVPLGQGDIGIAEFMKVAGQYGVKYMFIEDESSRSMEQVPQSLAFLRTVK